VTDLPSAHTLPTNANHWPEKKATPFFSPPRLLFTFQQGTLLPALGGAPLPVTQHKPPCQSHSDSPAAASSRGASRFAAKKHV